MDSKKAHLIYWAMVDRVNFYANFNQDSPEYEEIKRARVKISNRYNELKSEGLSFGESAHLATIEWLMSLPA